MEMKREYVKFFCAFWKIAIASFKGKPNRKA